HTDSFGEAMSKGPITSHVLDIARGKPAAGVRITLARQTEQASGAHHDVASRVTNEDGRDTALLPPGPAEPGHYRLTFDVGAYFAARGERSFYPRVTVDFEVASATEHYHVPLLLSPFGYSTYRGS